MIKGKNPGGGLTPKAIVGNQTHFDLPGPLMHTVLMTNQPQNVLPFLFSNTIPNMLLEVYLAYFREVK